VDHPPGGADDLANAACGALVLAASEAAPALWRSSSLLRDGQPAAWPAPANLIFTTCAADESGLFWALWARDASFGGPELALVDFGRDVFSRDLVVSLAKHIVAEARVAHAPNRVLYAVAGLAAEVAAVVTDEAISAISTGSASLQDFDVAVNGEDADELLRDRDALILAGASAIGGGRVKLTRVAAERSRTLPSPLTGLHPGAPPSAATDAALLALAVTFAEAPARPPRHPRRS
jgi:hypothetical protein